MAGRPFQQATRQRPGGQQAVQQVLQFGRVPAGHRLRQQRLDIEVPAWAARRGLRRLLVARHCATLAAAGIRAWPDCAWFLARLAAMADGHGALASWLAGWLAA